MVRMYEKKYVGRDKTHFGDLYASKGISLWQLAGGYLGVKKKDSWVM